MSHRTTHTTTVTTLRHYLCLCHQLYTNINVFKQARIMRARDVISIGAVKAKAGAGSAFDQSALLMAGYLKKRRETDR
jgi:hypothetical protein